MSRALLERLARRHLVLHMDINKTIIQVDLAGGRTLEDVLNSNVAANVLGEVDSEGKCWKPLYIPVEGTDAEPSPVSLSGLVTYDAFIDRLYCEPAGMQDLPKAERDALWKKISGLRREACKKFTYPGEVGHQYAHLVEKQRSALHENGSFSIIPSFFNFVNDLSDMNWPFTLIFRTFGSDMGSVLEEWKTFVEGNHVCKPRGVILAKMKECYVQPLCATVFRHSDDMFICYGPCVSLSYLDSSLDVSSPQIIMDQLRGVPGSTDVRKVSFTSLTNDLVGHFQKSNNVGGVVDYYPYWAQGAERRSCGKVYPIIQGDRNYFHVFFDDNIFLGDERSIVDIRAAATNESILDPGVEKKFCVPVNAFEAIVNKDYFVDRLYECLILQQDSSSV